LATEVLRPADHVHAHFLHTPTSVARYAARLVGARFSVSAHAKDIWTLPAWEKREKLLDAAWTVTCTRANAEHLNGLLDAPGKVRLAYHGLDLERFPSAPPRPPNDGRSPGAAVSLLTVARAVPKKGLDVLLDALARLPARLFWRFHHIGGGPEVARLRARASRLGLADRICWHGAQTAPSVLAAYRAADLFVLPSRIAGDGDRDGLPNVLMEALSQRLAVLATGVSAIPELIEDGRTGALVPPDDPDVLAAALAALIVDPGRRMALAGAGEDAVRGRFAMRHGIDVIDGLLVEPHAVAAA
ncbi:MAG: glycosyltransferase family 4 protein, partial [Pseudomonadota bacterium]